MSKSADFLVEALRQLGTKPKDSEPQASKKGYSEQLSARFALAFAEQFRRRGLDARPAPPGVFGSSGAERRMAGGIGAKKVDVTCATEESGLLLAASIKSINFADSKTKNYQKNLINRRGDMLFEAVTLHRRFPYAVLVGFFIFDEGAARDGTATRSTTFLNAHQAFRLFTGRTDPAGRDEQFEKLYIGLHGVESGEPFIRFYEAGSPHTAVDMDTILRSLIELVGERNFDLYEASNGVLKPRRYSKQDEEKPAE